MTRSCLQSSSALFFFFQLRFVREARLLFPLSPRPSHHNVGRVPPLRLRCGALPTPTLTANDKTCYSNNN